MKPGRRFVGAWLLLGSSIVASCRDFRAAAVDPAAGGAGTSSGKNAGGDSERGGRGSSGRGAGTSGSSGSHFNLGATAGSESNASGGSPGQSGAGGDGGDENGSQAGQGGRPGGSGQDTGGRGEGAIVSGEGGGGERGGGGEQGGEGGGATPTAGAGAYAAGGAAGAAAATGDSGAPGAGGAPSPVETVDVAVASRATGVLEVFSASSAGTIDYHRFNSGWEPPMPIPSPPGVKFSSVAATKFGNRLDVIASGPDGRLYHVHSTRGAFDSPMSFGAWTEILGVAPTGEPDSLALLSYDTALHAFWLTAAHGIEHTWGEFGLGDMIESGDINPTLMPLLAAHTLNVVVPRAGRIDFLLDGSAEFPLQHHWFDASDGTGWGGDRPHREQLACTKVGSTPLERAPSDFIALSTSGTSFEVFAIEPPGSAARPLLHGSFSTVSGWSGGLGEYGQVVFSTLDVGSAPPDRLVDALYWAYTYAYGSGDLFGIYAGSTVFWNFYSW